MEAISALLYRQNTTLTTSTGEAGILISYTPAVVLGNLCYHVRPYDHDYYPYNHDYYKYNHDYYPVQTAIRSKNVTCINRKVPMAAI